jgi:signal transduction histidine kinase
MKMYSERLTNEEKLEHLDTIQTQVERLTALLDDVLEISRAESMKVEIVLEALSIADLCREIVNDFQHISPNHQIQLHLAGDVAPITADVKLMRQIISNLVSNAVKYSPNHGTVEVRLTFKDRQVVLVVSDEGMGIPEDDLELLFTTFHRARNVGEIQGTGLGLAIVKQAIDAHGGTIAVNSTIGQGTTFTVTLPR